MQYNIIEMYPLMSSYTPDFFTFFADLHDILVAVLSFDAPNRLIS